MKRYEQESRGNDGGHPQPHYHRYNNFPQRSSLCTSSCTYLSSYNNSYNGPSQTASLGSLQKLSSSSSSTPLTVTSSSSPSDTSSPPLSSSSLSNQEDDISAIEESSTSAISLYEVFAAGISSKERQQSSHTYQSNNSSSSQPTNMNDDAVTPHNFTTNELNGDDYDDDDEKFNERFTDKDGVDDDGDLSTSIHPQQPQDDDEDHRNILKKYRRRICTLLVSTIALWIYSQLRTSKRRYRNQRRLKDSHNKRSVTIFDHERAMDLIRYLLRIISIPVNSIIRRVTQQQQRHLRLSMNKTEAPTKQTWENAISTPLSHLLAVAETGTISKVLVRGSMLTYLHTITPSPPLHQNNKSSPQQQQRWSKTTLPSQNPTIVNQIISTLLQKGCHDIVTLPESLWSRFWNGPAIVALPFAYLGGLYWIMRRLQQQQLEDDNGDNNNRSSKTSINTATTFADVAGINSSLRELSELVSFLRHPNEFRSIGAAPPRGILLHGPPGVGKTLLARAIAGELTRNTAASFPMSSMRHSSIDAFEVCAGSDFVETYVGRGAARVRALFRRVREDALQKFQQRRREEIRMKRTLKRLYTDQDTPSKRSSSLLKRAVSNVGEKIVGAFGRLQISSEEDDIQDSPLAIIFIDEIDALAKRRDSAVGGLSSLGGNDEREQTLNQLLTEMDGFKTGGPTDNVTVIVIAATNRPHVLDPAILRSGRFDRRVAVPLPDCQGREEILRLHAQRIRWDHATVNLRDIAEITPNFSGADLKCLINEAALLAVRNGSKMVLQTHLMQAAQKVKTGTRGG